MYTPDVLGSESSRVGELTPAQETVYASIRQRCAARLGATTMHVKIDERDPRQYWVPTPVVDRLRRDGFYVHTYHQAAGINIHEVNVCWGDDAYLRERGWPPRPGFLGLMRRVLCM
jgi:hypothetical protein